MEGERLICLRKPRFGERRLRSARANASLRQRSIVMIRKHIHTGAGCGQQIRCKQCVTGGAGTENHHPGSRLLDEGTEDFEVASVRGCIISCRRAVNRRQVGFIHELGGGDASAKEVGLGEKAGRLIRGPDARRIAGARTDGE